MYFKTEEEILKDLGEEDGEDVRHPVVDGGHLDDEDGLDEAKRGG